MGLRLRKSFGSKGFRVTVSKSGVGYSAGVKGFRVTKKANGNIQTTASIPNTGISYIDEISSKENKTPIVATGNNNGQQKHSLKLSLIMWIIGAGVIVIILIVIFCSYYQTQQHRKWIEEERAKHTWNTDFAFIDMPEMSYEYSTKNGGFRHIIKGLVINQSGYDIPSAKIIFGFYDTNDMLLGTASATIIDIDNSQKRNFQATTVEYFTEKAYVARVTNVEYSLIIN